MTTPIHDQLALELAATQLAGVESLGDLGWDAAARVAEDEGRAL